MSREVVCHPARGLSWAMVAERPGSFQDKRGDMARVLVIDFDRMWLTLAPMGGAAVFVHAFVYCHGCGAGGGASTSGMAEQSTLTVTLRSMPETQPTTSSRV